MKESIFAFLHLSAILAWVVFSSSQAALCRADWFNTAAKQRMMRLLKILWIATFFIIFTGLLRIFFGDKGSAYYFTNWIMHAKFTAFIIVIILMLSSSSKIIKWQKMPDNQIPNEAELNKTRKIIMIQTHIFAIIPLAGVLIARGFGYMG